MENKTAFSDFNDERWGTERDSYLIDKHIYTTHTHTHTDIPEPCLTTKVFQQKKRNLRNKTDLSCLMSKEIERWRDEARGQLSM